MKHTSSTLHDTHIFDRSRCDAFCSSFLFLIQAHQATHSIHFLDSQCTNCSLHSYTFGFCVLFTFSLLARSTHKFVSVLHTHPSLPYSLAFSIINHTTDTVYYACVSMHLFSFAFVLFILLTLCK
eukprot:204064_1